MATNKDILNKVIGGDSQKIRLAITDIDGILRGKVVSKEKFASIAEGTFGFCNVVFGWDSSDVCYDNVKYTGWHTGYPDAQVLIDLNTYRKVPWDNNIPFFLGEFVDSKNQPLSICPRQVLKKQIAKTKSLGYTAKIGLEYEWFNFQETPQSLIAKNFINPTPITPGMFGYSISRSSYKKDFFNALFDELLEFRIPLEGLHTETGPGVYEAAIAASDPLEAADRGVLLKGAVKEIAYRFGILPSFMAKWSRSLPGCGGHIHQSLLDLDGKTNLFYDAKNPYKMSPLFEQYLAGLLHCLPFLQPFFTPNINSYKRLVEGFWTPVILTWGVENRTTALRFIPGSEKSTRLELRISGADFNSYLGVAATLAAGLYGIENKMKLKDAPIVGNAYEKDGHVKLHRNLYDATIAMMNSDVAISLFGKEFIEHFGNSRLWEWQKNQEAITQWELERYFEII